MIERLEKASINEAQKTWIIRNAKNFNELYSAKAKLYDNLHQQFESGKITLERGETDCLIEMVQMQITELKFIIKYYEKQEDQLKVMKSKIAANETLEMLMDLRSKLLPQSIKKGETQNVQQ